MANEDECSNTCDANNHSSENENMHKDDDADAWNQSWASKESSANQAQVKVDEVNFDESIFPLENISSGKPRQQCFI